MKKNILIIIVILIISACNKDNNIDEKPIDSTKQNIEKIIAENNIKPSNSETIENIYVIDSLDYKIAFGTKNKNAWLAKFEANGNEIFSYELKDININNETFSSVRLGNPYFIDNNILFLTCIVTNESNFPEFWNGSYTLVKSIINFKTGKEIYKIIAEKSLNDLLVKKESGLIYSMTTEKEFFIMSLTGKLLWHRKTLDNEQENGLESYRDYSFLNSENIIYSVYSPQSYRNNYKVINLKNRELLFDVLSTDIPFIGERKDQENIVYREDKFYKYNNNIRIQYNELLEIKKTDEITGESSREYKILDKYYYDLDIETGEILNNSKL